MKERLRKIWETLKPEQKKKVLFAGIAIAVVILSLVFYKATRSAGTPPKTVEGKREILLEKGTLEKSLYNESTKQIGDMQNQLRALEGQLASLQQTPRPGDEKKDDKLDLAKEILKQSRQTPAEKKEEPKGTTKTNVPLPPPLPNQPSYPPGAPPAPPPPVTAQSKAEIYGDIEFVSQRLDRKDEGKKKEETKIYLPPSFMEATLLSGMYAPTTEGGKRSPMPALLRIKDLAILPNRVKGDLKGCFVMVEAHGSLADERAHARLTTLSCLTRGGQSVIDQKVKGYVVDEDGFVGLRGKVVSKMGAAIARSLVAGFVVGFGDAINASTITTTTSGVGVTQTLDTSQATTAGVGKGISQAGRDLQKFLLDLGKQAIPVVEVGAMRPVTVVISEGVEIQIKDIPNTCVGGTDRCGN